MQVAAGNSHTCAIRTDGTIACWGVTSYGVTTPPSGTYISIASGDRYSCAITSGGIETCWGSIAR